jgi:hypothetical protein
VGCVVLHAATANVATTARNSGRFSIFSNSLELLILFPSTDSTLLQSCSCEEIVCARYDSIGNLRHISFYLCTPALIALFSRTSDALGPTTGKFAQWLDAKCLHDDGPSVCLQI